MSSSLNMLPPAWAQFGAWMVFGSAAALVAVHSTMFALAGERTTLPRKTRARVALLAALLLGAWLGWAIVVAHQRGLVGPQAEGGSPLASLPTLLAMLLAIGVGASFLGLRAVRELNAAMPCWWLIAVQVYRFAGIVFVWPYLSYGLLPAGFAIPAGIGDAITGLAAPFVAFAVARGLPGAPRLAVAWNWFGIVDLLVAPTAAVLTRTQVATIYPLGLIPIFLGPPLGILTHLYSLRNLAANRAAQQAERSA